MEKEGEHFNGGGEETGLMRRYLLGDLSEAEQSRLEERCFGDERLSLRLRAVRDEMVDAYVRDQLPPRERERFEEHFMASPPRRERVEFARALIEKLDRPAVRANRPPAANAPGAWRRFPAGLRVEHGPTLAAAVLLAVALGTWLIYRNLTAGGTVARPGVEQVAREGGGIDAPPSLAPSQTPEAVTRESPGPVPPPATQNRRGPAAREPRTSVATFVLTPDLVRGGGGAQKLIIPRGTERVRLRLGVEAGDYESYGVRLRTPEGAGVWTKDGVKARPGVPFVVVTVPAKVFGDADYTLSLSGKNDGGEPAAVARYYFKVERK